jgi:hypothetical protein
LNKLIKTLINVSSLLVVQPLNFLFDVLNKLSVIIVDSFCVDHQLIQIINILFYDIGDILQLCKLVTIVIAKHALWTDDSMTELAKVFNFFILMLKAVDLASVRLGHLHLRHARLLASATLR